MGDAVIFDVDGTLINSVDLHARAWQAALERFGKHVPYLKVRQQIGQGGGRLLPLFLSPGELDRFGQELQAWRDRHYQDDFLPRARPFPYVRELFARLKADGLRVAVATSGKRAEVDVSLERADVTALVDVVVTGDDLDATKPNPEAFELALAKLGGRDGGRVVVVGDSPYDAQAARRAGLEAIGVLSGGFTAAELRAAGCSLLFEDCADLLHRYSSWQKARPQQAGEEFVIR